MELVERCFTFLDSQKGGRVFIVVYWVNPHAPYRPSKRYDLWSDASGPIVNIAPAGEEGPGFIAKDDINTGRRMLDDSEWYQLVAQYDGEIRQNDAYLDILFQGILSRGLEDSTMIIICSDHGEGFDEHERQRVWHDLPYDTILRVPLVIHYPGVFPVRRVKTAVSLADLYPTIVKIAGGRVTHSINGKDLRDALKRNAKDRTIAGATHFWGGTIFYRGDGMKFFYSRKGAERPEIYDLTQDPEEQTNLAESNPALVAEFKQRLSRFLAATAIHIEGAGEKPTTLGDIERLRALGYVE
jgi:arylsulfatase A-like enzyme